MIEDSDSESSCQMLNEEKTVEPTDTSFEKCSGALDNAENILCMANTNNSTDGDAAFLMLIAKELAKMAPSTRQKFKRNVTQLLYS